MCRRALLCIAPALPGAVAAGLHARGACDCAAAGQHRPTRVTSTAQQPSLQPDTLAVWAVMQRSGSQGSWSHTDLCRYLLKGASKLGLCSLSPDSRQTHLGCVATDEMVHGLLPRQPTHGRQHPESVAAQQDQVLGVGPHAGDTRIVNVLDGVRGAGVFGHRTAAHTWQGQKRATGCRKGVGERGMISCGRCPAGTQKGSRR